MRITEEYNSSPLATRQATTKQLRRLWINTKQRQREALTKERQHRLATGGGSSISDAVIDPDVSMVAPALIVGIDNAIDSDAFEDSSQSTDLPTTIETEDIVYILPHTSQTSIIAEEQVITVDPLVQPESQISQPSTPTQPNTVPPVRNTPPRTTGGSNIRTVQIKKNVIEQEYKDRSVRATQKHNLEMQILRVQLREAKAKADLAELILREKLNSAGSSN